MRPFYAALFTAALIGLAAPASAQHQSTTTFGPEFPGTIYEHNGSTMEMRVHRGIVEITYLFPRAGLPEAVEHGTVLFDGAAEPVFDGSGNFVRYTYRVSGTAYVFSGRCGAFPYRVRGSFSSDKETLKLFGAAPMIDSATCAVIRYDPDSFNTVLVFRRDRQPIVE